MNILNKLGPFTPFVGVVILLFIWQVAFWVEVVDHVLLPSPGSMFAAVWQGMTGGQLLIDFLRTIERTSLSILYAGLIGIPLGIILGSSTALYRSVEFVVDFFRSTPASAVFPLFLAISGPGDATKIQVAAFGASLVILFNVAYGVMNARKTRLQAAQVMGGTQISRAHRRDVV